MKKTFSKEEIPKISKEILKSLIFNLKSDKALVVALSGELGAGKTTLTQEIAKQLGIKENIISPTFVLIKSYGFSNKLIKLKVNKLVHIDAYRFDSSDELLKLGWNELISDPKNLIIIEWPERVEEIIPKDAIRIKLTHVDEERRNIDIKSKR